MTEVGTPVEAGSFLGPFELRRFLGRGSFGEVYLAQDRSAGSRVCLKVLSRSASDKVRGNLQREASMLERLGHPGVPRLKSSGEVAGRLYLAMAFHEGRTLRSVLKKARKLEPTRARELFEETLRILHHCHSRGVLHLDLKPENLLVDEAGRPTLLDFGLARDRSAGPVRGKAGTPRYMAPEQLMGKPAEPCTDLYQLALVLVECLEGRPAMRSRSSGDRALEERREPRELAPEFPEEWRVVVRRMTHPDPSRRYGDAAAVLQALGARGPEREETGNLPAVRVRALGSSRPEPEDLETGWIPSSRELLVRLLLGVSVGYALGPALPYRLALGAFQLLSLVAESGKRSRLLAFQWGVLLSWIVLAVLWTQWHWAVWVFLVGPVMLPLLGVAVGALWLTGLPPLERLLRSETWRPSLRELLTPGMGHVDLGRPRTPWVVGWMMSFLLVFGPTGPGAVLVGGLLAFSLGLTLLGGLDRARELEREEVRLLLSMGEESEEKARCQAGLSLLTARLVPLVRRGEWEPPALEKGSLPLEGKQIRALVAEIPEVAPCFHAGRVLLHVSRGVPHLLCQRHNLCPSPLPRACDREAGTMSGSTAGTSTEGSVGELQATLYVPEEPTVDPDRGE